MLIKDSKRSIGQAAKEVGISETVIRYWETQFPDYIQPTVGLGGRRYYYNKDIKILINIKDFLYTQGYTIKGLQNFLLANGGFKDEEIEEPQKNIYAETKVPESQKIIVPKIDKNDIQQTAPRYTEQESVFQRYKEEPIQKYEEILVPKKYEEKPIIQKEYVYINKGLDTETKIKLNNFQNKLVNFGIQLENFENIS